MREDVVAMIAGQRAGLLETLADLEGPTWDTPTACEGWGVRDVVAHLVEGELGVGRTYRGEEETPGVVDLTSGIERWRALPAEAVRAALWQHGTATQRVLDAMNAERWHADIEAFGCRTIGQLVRLHLFEAAVHGHDITDALARPALWNPCLPFLVEFVVRAAPRTLGRGGFDGAPPYTISAGARTWRLTRNEGRWAVDRATGAATATLRADPGGLVLAVTGRAPLDAALAGMTIEGDEAEAARLLAAWQILG